VTQDVSNQEATVIRTFSFAEFYHTMGCMNDDCLFCKIIRKEVPSTMIYEDADVYAFSDINPIHLGHTLVIPKQHYVNVFDLPDDLLSKMFIATKKVANAIKATVGADGINISMNNDPAAGQVVFHAHLHVVPRYKDDGFHHWKGKGFSLGDIHDTGEKIRSKLE
jgi:histidine triad (HIT) family protein